LHQPPPDGETQIASRQDARLTQLKPDFSIEEIPKRFGERTGVRFRIRVRPLLELVQVTRTRPPARHDFRLAAVGARHAANKHAGRGALHALTSPTVDSTDAGGNRHEAPVAHAGSLEGEPAGIDDQALVGRASSLMPLPPPQPVHARQPTWRVHLAGVRGDVPGLASAVLLDAGRRQGYHVRCQLEPAGIGPRQFAAAQILFTAGYRLSALGLQPKANSGQPTLLMPAEITAAIPFGEADLLVGLDAAELMRSVDPGDRLRVASATRTYLVADTGECLASRGGASSLPINGPKLAALAAVTLDHPRFLFDVAGACRTSFGTDRVCDMALLGAAFQLGLIPLTSQAIEAALIAAQSRGYGRCKDAFDFGRRLTQPLSALGSGMTAISRQPTADSQRPKIGVDRLIRRLALTFRRGNGPCGGLLRIGARRSQQFATLARQSLAAMPGLAESDAGRQARRDFVLACHACVIWGGLEYAHRYAELIRRLYESDRADTARALTRHAVLPLAEAMLIRDPLYVAGVAMSPEQRRSLRRALNVKRARGDQIQRRYLTRVEVIAMHRRIRIDLRTSDWPTRVGAVVAPLIPKQWRGTRRERQLRDYVIECVKRAAAGAPSKYEHWNEVLLRLHNQALEHRLRGMAMAEVRMLAGM
jgi:Pyruvate/2-oxoacid:ferredoxin oxidoreductase gamma subunit